MSEGGASPDTVDRRAVAAGALLTVAVTAPVSVAARVWEGGSSEGDSALWVVPVVALLAGFYLGGRLAARRRRDAPLRHSAASGALASVVLAVGAVARRLVAGDGVTTPLLVTLLLLLQITISVSVLAGYVVARGEARGQREQGQGDGAG